MRKNKNNKQKNTYYRHVMWFKKFMKLQHELYKLYLPCIRA